LVEAETAEKNVRTKKNIPINMRLPQHSTLLLAYRTEERQAGSWRLMMNRFKIRLQRCMTLGQGANKVIILRIFSVFSSRRERTVIVNARALLHYTRHPNKCVRMPARVAGGPCMASICTLFEQENRQDTPLLFFPRVLTSFFLPSESSERGVQGRMYVHTGRRLCERAQMQFKFGWDDTAAQSVTAHTTATHIFLF
jgi:hypothetical protein